VRWIAKKKAKKVAARKPTIAKPEESAERSVLHEGEVISPEMRHNPILAFTMGADDWRALLADPEKQWRTGYSARTLAYSWEAADGSPPEVGAAFSQTDDPLLAALSPVVAVPEFTVPLPGGRHPSQNDIFVLARSEAGPVCIMVEGKVDEVFGPTLSEWLAEASTGKKLRLRFLTRTLGLAAQLPDTARYQLLHRATSAVVTAEQYRAVAAVVLVHSFSQKSSGWSDYVSFAGLFGVDAIEGAVQRLRTKSAVPLFGVWGVGNESFLKS
jgi:hypothetical protein